MLDFIFHSAIRPIYSDENSYWVLRDWRFPNAAPQYIHIYMHRCCFCCFYPISRSLYIVSAALFLSCCCWSKLTSNVNTRLSFCQLVFHFRVYIIIYIRARSVYDWLHISTVLLACLFTHTHHLLTHIYNMRWCNSEHRRKSVSKLYTFFMLCRHKCVYERELYVQFLFSLVQSVNFASMYALHFMIKSRHMMGNSYTFLPPPPSPQVSICERK